MPELAKRDPKAPRFLQITIKDSKAKEWTTTITLKTTKDKNGAINTNDITAIIQEIVNDGGRPNV